MIIIKKKGSTNLPVREKCTPTTPQKEVTVATVKE